VEREGVDARAKPGHGERENSDAGERYEPPSS
jgi:hypothetical protein